MKHILLTLFLFFFVSSGWCIKISAPVAAPVNLLKGVQATFELWDTTPTALNLTDENFNYPGYTLGIGTITAAGDIDIGRVYFDLGSVYNNILVGAYLNIHDPLYLATVFIDIGTSTDGITWTYLDNGQGTVSDGDGSRVGLILLPINTRYFSLKFYDDVSGETARVEIRLIEITATQYK